MSQEGWNLFWPSDPPQDRDLDELLEGEISYQETQDLWEFLMDQRKKKKEEGQREF